jgi:hypothetical protein
MKITSGEVELYECVLRLSNTVSRGSLPVVQLASAGSLRLERCTLLNTSGDEGGDGGEAIKWLTSATTALRCLDSLLKKSGASSYTIDSADSGMSAILVGNLLSHAYNSAKISLGVAVGNDVGDFT